MKIRNYLRRKQKEDFVYGMRVYTKGKYDTYRYCCGSMAECRDEDVIEHDKGGDGKFKIGNEKYSYVLHSCPFCGSNIVYLDKELTRKMIGEMMH